MSAEARDDAVMGFLAAVAAADPSKLVKAKVRTGALDDWLGDLERPNMIHVLAIGKAAPRMAWGLVEAGVPFRGIGVTTQGQTRPTIDTMTWHVGGHPLPDEGSVRAGHAVLDWVERLPQGATILVLLSGGASSCIEPTDDLAKTRAAWKGWADRGLDIVELNSNRSRGSSVKGGALGRKLRVRGADVRAWAISDMPPGTEDHLGSGPLAGTASLEVLADNGLAIAAAGASLQQAGWTVYRHAARIDGPVASEAAAFIAAARGLSGPRIALVGGGEPTVILPAGAPPGGRAQHAALFAAARLQEGETFLAAGTDGIDGTTREAGAVVTSSDADGDALATFDAHRHLAARSVTLRTGATGTNVNDLWILLRD